MMEPLEVHLGFALKVLWEIFRKWILVSSPPPPFCILPNLQDTRGHLFH